MLTFEVFEKSRRFSALQNLTLFLNFLHITSKYAQKHHMIKNQKNSFTGKKLTNCENGQKGAKMVVFWHWKAEF